MAKLDGTDGKARAGGADTTALAEGEFVVHPAHGVGQVTSIEERTVAGVSLKLVAISFAKEHMVVRIPVAKVAGAGVRRLSDASRVDAAVAVLSTRPKAPRGGLWAKRAQDFEARIATGAIAALAEVARDTFRGTNQEEASYSQKLIHELAMDRLSLEVATVRGTPVAEVRRDLEATLTRSLVTRGRAAAATTEDSEGVEEAA